MKKKILIAEDDQLIQRMLKNKLIREGFDVEQFYSGKPALEYLKDNSVDVVLTDLYMPVLDGHQFIDKIRNELKSNVPIIVVSGLVDKETILKSYELGANYYLTKPIDMVELINCIKANG